MADVSPALIVLRSLPVLHLIADCVARIDLAEHEFASSSVARDAAQVALAAHPAELILALVVQLPLPTIWTTIMRAHTANRGEAVRRPTAEMTTLPPFASHSHPITSRRIAPSSSSDPSDLPCRCRDKLRTCTATLAVRSVLPWGAPAASTASAAGNRSGSDATATHTQTGTDTRRGQTPGQSSQLWMRIGCIVRAARTHAQLRAAG